MLEETFVCGLLVQQDDQVPVARPADLGLNTEYNEFCEKLQGAHDNDFEYGTPPLTIPSGLAEEVRSPAEVDEWDAEQIGLSDSVSFVAEGSARKHVDRWREVCGM